MRKNSIGDLMRSIVILVEHPDRELLVAEAIGRAVKELDSAVNIKIVSILFNVEEAILAKHYDLIVFPSNWPIINSISALRNGATYLSLNFEQMLSNFNKQAKRPAAGFITTGVNHFSWSREYSDYLVESGIDISRIYEIQKPIFQALARMSASHWLAIDNGLLIKLTAYDRIVFAPLTCLQAFKSDARLRREFGSGDLFDRAIARRDFVRSSVETIFFWVAKLAEERPRVAFVLRPHPSVSTSTYAEVFERLNIKKPSNVLITHNGTAIQWITKSQIVMSNYSSLLLDGLQYGTPSFILQPLPFPDDISYTWFSRFEKIRLYEELRAVLDHSSGATSVSRLYNGVDASARVIVKLLKFRAAREVVVGHPRISDFLAVGLFMAKAFIRKLLYRWVPFTLRDGLKRDYFKAVDL